MNKEPNRHTFEVICKLGIIPTEEEILIIIDCVLKDLREQEYIPDKYSFNREDYLEIEYKSDLREAYCQGLTKEATSREIVMFEKWYAQFIKDKNKNRTIDIT